MKSLRLALVVVFFGLAAVAWLARGPLADRLYEQGREARSGGQSEWAARYTAIAAGLGHVGAQLERVRALEERGETERAQLRLERLLEAEHDDPELRARLLAARARQWLAADRLEDARAAFRDAIRLAEELPDPHRLGRILLDSADAYPGEGDGQGDGKGNDMAEARQRIELALAIARQSEDARLEADALLTLGIFHWYRLRQRETTLEDFYRPALELYRQLDHPAGIARARSCIGLAHLARRELEASARELEISLDIYTRIGNRRGLTDVHAYLGALQTGLENLEQAHGHYSKSLELATELRDREGLARIEPLLAHLELRRGEFERAAELYGQLADRAPNPSVARRDHLTQRGNALLHLGKPTEAAECYRLALRTHDALGVEEAIPHTSILVGRAHALRMSGELEAAHTTLDEAESIPIRKKGWGQAAYIALARADLAHQKGDAETALGYLVQAAEIESRTYGVARSHFFQTQYVQVFDRLFALLLDGVTETRTAEELTFRLLEQMRYRSFRSILVQADATGAVEAHGDASADRAVEESMEPGRIEARIEELSRRVGGRIGGEDWQALEEAYTEYENFSLRRSLAAASYRMASDARPIDLDALRKRLPPGMVLVEYVLTTERAFVLVVSSAGIGSAVLPASVSKLRDLSKLFRDRLFETDPTAPSNVAPPVAGSSDTARELGRLLIDPLEATGAFSTHAGEIEHLVIVPMGFLHELPFAALVDASGKRLIEKYSLSRAPSATAWARRARDTAVVAMDGRRSLALGLRSAEGSEEDPLELAEVEASTVARLTGGEALIGPRATESNFLRLAPNRSIVHLAAHAIYEQRLPLHSRLLLEADGENDGQLTLRELLELRLDAELVTLSACNTARGRSVGLEVDRLGFVEALLHIGARNVIATLTPIPDDSGAVLMDRFYQQLAEHPPAEALARAQRQMLRSEKHHPRHWAPFVLVGG